MSDSPVVSVVTPVYNGGRYLAECIDSVLGQRYPRIDHVILDNASSDDTRAVAERYADRDPRIRLFANRHTLPVIENWNHALGFISKESAYVWVLPADDAIMPDALAKMVDLAERHPSVGIVGCYRLRGEQLQCTGLPADQEVFSGRDIVRSYLREEVFALAPTGSLIRRTLVDQHQPFYRDCYLHGDIAAFFDVLDQVDFGFVHEALMFSRPHAGSMTSTVAGRNGTLFSEGLLMLQEFGPRYFESDELAEIEKRFLKRYYRFLLRSAVTLREPKFFSLHAAALRRAGRLPGAADIGRAALDEFAQALRQPHKVVHHLRQRLGYG